MASSAPSHQATQLQIKDIHKPQPVVAGRRHVWGNPLAPAEKNNDLFLGAVYVVKQGTRFACKFPGLTPFPLLLSG